MSGFMLKIKTKIQLNAATYLLLFGLISCGSDPYVYDRYDPTTQNSQMNPQMVNPQMMNQQMMNPQMGQAAPNPYYRQGQAMPPQQNYQPQQYQQQQPYPPQPNPYVSQPNPYTSQGGSRFYANPYTITNSYPGYDVDQYYVPPTNYGGEVQQNQVKNYNENFYR